ncbi:MAG: DUF6106 family protein [Lachnospiraceae bacterium]|nr:DUF6106 family protein [Lachnospiraceae bacterium]
MNETYVECLVQTKPNMPLRLLKYLAIVLAAGLGLFSLLTGGFVTFILAIASGIGAYFAHSYSDIEYEYLYVDHEISIDKVIAKSRRKKVIKLETDKMEIFAPLNSHELDSYNNRQCTVKDFSSRIEKQPEARYALFYEGQKKYILEPSEEFVKALSNIAPRKVKTY